MPVRVTDQTGQTHTGKFADFREGSVSLWSGIMSDKKGGFRGCGRKVGVFPEGEVAIDADEPGRETRRR